MCLLIKKLLPWPGWFCFHWHLSVCLSVSRKSQKVFQFKGILLTLSRQVGSGSRKSELHFKADLDGSHCL